MNSMVLGLVVISTVSGLALTFLWHIFLLKVAKLNLNQEVWNNEEYLLTGLITGVCERFLFTVFIGFSGVSGVATAAIGWVAIKGQLHYHIFTKDAPEVSRAYVGILGSVFSLCIAFIGGVIWHSGHSWELDQTIIQNIQTIRELLSNK